MCGKAIIIEGTCTWIIIINKRAWLFCKGFLECLLGTLRDDDYDNNNNIKKQLVLWAKQLLCMCITLFNTFLWHPLHDYDVKPPNVTFYGGCGNTTTNFPFSIWTWIKPEFNSRKSCLHLTNWAVRNRSNKVWKDANSFIFFSDVFTAIVIIIA